jgi:hypothetical protein
MSLAGKMAVWVLAIAASWALPASSHEIKFGNLIIVHPWARPLPDTPDVLAGYLKIINTGKEDDRLIGATAEIAGSAEFEDMNMDNGVMKTSVVSGGIPIPVGKTVALTSKSLHIMFLNVKSQPMEGTEFKGTLTFEKAGTIDIDFEVGEMAAH